MIRGLSTFETNAAIFGFMMERILGPSPRKIVSFGLELSPTKALALLSSGRTLRKKGYRKHVGVKSFPALSPIVLLKKRVLSGA